MLTDHQPQMVFSVQSHDTALLRNNIAGLAKTAKLFSIPTILTSITAATFSGKTLSEIQSVFPDQKPIDRTTMNAWDDLRVVRQINAYGKGKIVIAGMWTEVCLLEPVLSAISDGYEVYFVSDASGGVTKEAHDMAVIRMTQAGATPITWLQYLLELQRDWALKETYNGTLDIVRQHGGAYGLGVIYANEMFGAFT
ncbi:hydrolase [Neobacillus novalis]|uniref:Hydrolase n=1 Tax=Neobacillus novalis TaxID=220687 RepID=A0AA95SDJ9_9BACI|nr:hydrolase [Neobacillus novalis]WHY88919.1 hydrolase [Neobacillus novalis]